MGDAEWLAIGFLIGVLVGIPLGWLLLQSLVQTGQQPQQRARASVLFDRDEAGRITAIHYVPA
jgi:ABC-type antimicrobial peptide transport system permease subunit